MALLVGDFKILRHMEVATTAVFSDEEKLQEDLGLIIESLALHEL